MNFVLEASGVTETVANLRKAEKEEEEKERMRDFVDKDGKPMYFSKENATQIYGEYEAGKLELLDGFYKSLSSGQVSSIKFKILIVLLSLINFFLLLSFFQRTPKVWKFLGYHRNSRPFQNFSNFSKIFGISRKYQRCHKLFRSFQ